MRRTIVGFAVHVTVVFVQAEEHAVFRAEEDILSTISRIHIHVPRYVMRRRDWVHRAIRSPADVAQVLAGCAAEAHFIAEAFMRLNVPIRALGVPVIRIVMAVGVARSSAQKLGMMIVQLHRAPKA